MPPATSTSVPAAAMISVADCWSRMFEQVRPWSKNAGSSSESTTNRIDERDQDPERSGARISGRPTRRARAARAWRSAPRPPRRSPGLASWLSANAAARIAASVIASPSSSATMRPRRITSTRWARPRISSSSDEISRTPRPVGGERDEDVVDRALRADVDAARRLVGDHHAAARRAASARTAPSAGCRPRARRPAPSSSRRARRSARGRRCPARALAAAADDARGAELAEARERRVLDRRAPEDETVVLARLGDHREPGAEAQPRAPPGAASAGEHDLARLDPRRRRRSRARARCARRRRARRARRSRPRAPRG